jgi:hypothetical protein
MQMKTMGVKAWLEAQRHPFQEPQGTRRYPGESAGRYLAEYLNQASCSTNGRALLRSVYVIQELAQAVDRHDVDAVDRLRKRGLKFAYANLTSAINSAMSTRMSAFDVHENGLIVQATTPEGRAALAVLLLEKQRRLTRVRQCLHCGSWFYARFKHQGFCNNPQKRCQWNHYHTPDWRKRHREKNRKHQRAYRERNFGKKR